MGNRHVSLMIAAPPETVFGLYTDPGRVRDWQSGVRDLRVAGPPDQPGSRAVIAYRWPFKMTAEVLQVEPPARHVQRLKELLGLVTCTTTARLRPVEGATELHLDSARCPSAVAGRRRRSGSPEGQRRQRMPRRDLLVPAFDVLLHRRPPAVNGPPFLPPGTGQQSTK
jgi:hypothetical protein